MNSLILATIEVAEKSPWPSVVENSIIAICVTVGFIAFISKLKE